MERKGSLSQQRMSQISISAAKNMQASRVSAKTVPGSGVIARKPQRMMIMENNEKTHQTMSPNF